MFKKIAQSLFGQSQSSSEQDNIPTQRDRVVYQQMDALPEEVGLNMTELQVVEMGMRHMALHMRANEQGMEMLSIEPPLSDAPLQELVEEALQQLIEGKEFPGLELKPATAIGVLWTWPLISKYNWVYRAVGQDGWETLAICDPEHRYAVLPIQLMRKITEGNTLSPTIPKKLLEMVIQGTLSESKPGALLNLCHDLSIYDDGFITAVSVPKLPEEDVDESEEEIVEAIEVTPLEDARREIVDFMTEKFGPVDKLALQELLPIMENASVAVNVIRPTEERPILTLFTIGMSDIAMSVPEGQERFKYAELIIHLPGNWKHPEEVDSNDDPAFWPVQLLRQIAYHPHLKETWLGGKYTTFATEEPPAPLGSNTEQSSLLLMGNDIVSLSDGREIVCYTMLPLHTNELYFTFEQGIETFLEIYSDAIHTNTVHIDRPCLV